MAAIVDYLGGSLPDPARRDELGDLVAFRRGWYGCLRQRADALFELGDAALGSAGAVTSLPRLS